MINREVTSGNHAEVGLHNAPGEERSSKFNRRLPDAREADWDSLISTYCRGRKVLDLGCGAAPDFESFHRRGMLLHAKICAAARETVGVEIDPQVVDQMQKSGFHVVWGDAERLPAADDLRGFEVVVAGDIIEHLNNPGRMLESVKRALAPNGLFIISTPNPFRWYNPVLAAAGREFNHPDHTCWFSPLNLTELASRYGYEIVQWHVMDKVDLGENDRESAGRKVAKVVFNASDALVRRVLLRGRIWLHDTIIAVLSRRGLDDGSPPDLGKE